MTTSPHPSEEVRRNTIPQAGQEIPGSEEFSSESEPDESKQRDGSEDLMPLEMALVRALQSLESLETQSPTAAPDSDPPATGS